ncbi:MAG: cystathionine gamma-synthase [Alphaproteobacteria bacterium]|nr:cystathionine gamma-synthase [Alphaproteobacteria bacterium]
MSFDGPIPFSSPHRRPRPARHAQTALAAAAVGAPAGRARPAAPPLFLSATYAWDDPAEKPDYDYARSGNPTRAALEAALAELEGAAAGVVTATGMAAVNLPLCLVKPGERIIAPHDCYGGTHRLLRSRAALGHFEVDWIDQTDPAALDAAFARPARLVLIETPSNPLLRITDIEDVTARAHRAGAIVVADNTFLSPALQNPLALGCDVVIHSTTKYLNGHSDVVGGAALAKDAELGAELAWWANCTGVTGSPFDSYLTLRGARTLFARIERQQATAGIVAESLAADDRVARVYYPGLSSHKGHELAARQQRGFGAMLSAELRADVDTLSFLRALRIFNVAESLGGFESLVCCPATMTHAAMTPEARATAGISDRLVRFSVGLEHADDLLADLEDALDAAAAPAERLVNG